MDLLRCMLLAAMDTPKQEDIQEFHTELTRTVREFSTQSDNLKASIYKLDTKKIKESLDEMQKLSAKSRELRTKSEELRKKYKLF
ncbi:MULTISPECIES: hypothetical protein [Bacillus cereus group]|uniref:hypothetical protein n=1 Tax=Bacillus cereus group TaxID=86661 RepID=UPI000BF37B16|nr:MULTISPECIES: hypothetical protein [Bacillus cereus group]PEZ18543.1 hypothetical protein CN337_22370 [Bacillus anthracis]